MTRDEQNTVSKPYIGFIELGAVALMGLNGNAIVVTHHSLAIYIPTTQQTQLCLVINCHVPRILIRHIYK